jgi:hypothetical protein
MFLPFLVFMIAWFLAFKQKRNFAVIAWFIGFLLAAVQFKLDMTDALNIGL